MVVFGGYGEGRGDGEDFGVCVDLVLVEFGKVYVVVDVEFDFVEFGFGNDDVFIGLVGV